SRWTHSCTEERPCRTLVRCHRRGAPREQRLAPGSPACALDVDRRPHRGDSLGNPESTARRHRAAEDARDRGSDALHRHRPAPRSGTGRGTARPADRRTNRPYPTHGPMTHTPDPEVLPRAPATGSDYPPDTEIMPGEEPVTTGTVFLTAIILMIIVAVWVILYTYLLDR